MGRLDGSPKPAGSSLTPRIQNPKIASIQQKRGQSVVGNSKGDQLPASMLANKSKPSPGKDLEEAKKRQGSIKRGETKKVEVKKNIGEEEKKEESLKKKGKKSSTMTADATGPDEFNQMQLDAHNKYRADHGVPPLEYDPVCQKAAQAWADNMVKKKKMYHASKKENPNMGENLAMYSSSDPNDKTLSQTPHATEGWYDEIKDYDFNNQGFSMECGHFTQVVWKESTKVGFGIAGTYVVARYLPHGNM